MPYQWNPDGMHYTEGGRAVPNGQVQARALEYVDGVSREARHLAEAVLRESISLPEFEAQMRQLIKESHINMLRLGGGGREAVTSQYYGRSGAAIREQYRYLRGFVADLRSGRYDGAPGQALARAQMYGRASYQEYWFARHYAAQAAGYLWKRRVLHATESCPDCVDQAGLGWVGIHDERVTGVRDGSTQCLVHCACDIDYSHTLPSG